MDEPPTTRHSLLVRLRDPRDAEAWTEFLGIYEPLVYRLARKKGFQDADAMDLSQEVFRSVAAAIERWDPDPGRGSFRAWLFRIARNLMVNFLAGQRRQPRGAGDTDMNRLLEAQPAPCDDDSALFDAEYRAGLFRWAADAIQGEFTASTWQAFWRTAVEAHDVKQVASELGLSVGAVYIARSRVLARLRARIERVEGETPSG